MNRTGLIIALAIAAVTGLVFGLYPQLDLMIAAPFYAMKFNGYDFGGHVYPPLMLARDIGLWVSAALVLPAIAALVIKLIMPKRKLLISGRAIVFLIATLALGPGLFVNVLLKDHWGRPRPAPVILEQDIDEQPGSQRQRRDQEYDGAAGDQQLALRHDQFDHQRRNRRQHQGGADPQTDVACQHQRRIDVAAEIVAVELHRVKRRGDHQVELRIEAEHQAGDGGDGQRDDQSGAVHAVSV